MIASRALPTLVIHGTADPIIPYEHRKALAEAIPGAELLTIDDVGHLVFLPGIWDIVVPAVLEHTQPS